MSDMDLIVAVQRTQFLALREMQERRDKVDTFIQQTRDTPGRTVFFSVDRPPQVVQQEALVAALRADPCLAGHRPAYLVSGGLACHTCGIRLT